MARGRPVSLIVTGTWLPHRRSPSHGRGRPGRLTGSAQQAAARPNAAGRVPVRTGWIRAGAVAGVVGPAAFTLAWVVSAFRQRGLSFATPQISGLAADNARDPWLMITGFLLLGGGAVALGAALSAALGGRRQAGGGPAAIQAAGVLTIATGLLRRDHVLLTSGPESWHNHAHDVVSAAAYVLLIAAPLLLARRLRSDQGWRGLATPLAGAAIVSAALLVAFYAAPHDSWDATLQRIAVTLPLAAIVAVAVRLARLTGEPGAASPGDADASGHAHAGRAGQPE
jgi:hypothetical protein